MDKNKLIRDDIEKFANNMGVSVVEKDTSRLMILISWILFFNARFMKDFITTVFSTVYFPKRFLEIHETVWSVLVHELIHAYDMRNWWRIIIFGGGYVMPQLLGGVMIIPMIFLVIFHSWWWLLCLLLLAPIPCYVRYWIEIRGYTGTLATLHWRGYNMEDAIPGIVSHFVTSDYYWMWPFRGMVENKLKENIQKIKDGSIMEEIPILKEMGDIVQNHLKE